ncbi:unnamed protein product [Paramecium pentaurelia]|uniref:Uncharacterized protein n=1 Tax=Paramecium pentaurelia TaxID=43138 RepID=A0A8S1V339_9CILI|nr:unnamed protein product [Paramecium pentaurelia]
MNLNPRIQIEGNQFHLIYEKTNDELLDLMEKGISQNRLVLRKNGYCVTDKKTKMKYIVNYSRKHLKLSFQKSDLQEYDLEVLIESLSKKINQQQSFMKIMFSKISQLNENCIREIEYAPTDIVIEIIFGRMMIAKFYISYIIGNSLMSVDERFARFMLINLELLEGNVMNLEIFKQPPINLHFLTQFTAIDKFTDLIQRTFIPIQLLNYKIFDNNMLNSLYQYYFMVYPNQQFATFVFGIRSDKFLSSLGIIPLLIQMKTYFLNDKLVIEIEQADAFAILNGYHQVTDFAFFKQEIHDVITKWTFSTCQEIDEFFMKFLIIGTGYILLYPKKEMLFYLMKKTNWDYFLKQIFNPLINKIALLHLQLSQKQRSDSSNFDYRKFFNLHIDRYFHIYEYICIKEPRDERENPIKSILKYYLDRAEKNFLNIVKNNFKENEFNTHLQKLSMLQFQVDKISFIFQNIEYNALNGQIIRIDQGHETNRWKFNEFPKYELEYILSQF